MFGLTALVLALAGPRWPDPGSRIPTEGVALAVVLDVSASMAEEDFAWDEAKVSRLEGARRAIRLFVAGGGAAGGALTGRPDDLVALVTFATRPETACPLTLDHAALLKVLDAQEPRTASGEATTNPGDALAWALVVLQQAPARSKAVLFFTDGERQRSSRAICASRSMPSMQLPTTSLPPRWREPARRGRRWRRCRA
jgi:Ca-activated chloride channel family protein